jgi:hypothetical protein
MAARDLQTPQLFHNIIEDTRILYMYAEVTHCGTVCYLLVTSPLALGTNFMCSNGEIRTVSVSNVNFMSVMQMLQRTVYM